MTNNRKNKMHRGSKGHWPKAVICMILALVLSLSVFPADSVLYASAADENAVEYTVDTADETMEEESGEEAGTEILPDGSEVTDEAPVEPDVIETAEPDAEETPNDAEVDAEEETVVPEEAVESEEDAETEETGESEEIEEAEEFEISLLADDEDMPTTYDVTVVYFDENNDRITYSPAETIDLTTGSVTTVLEDASLQTRTYGSQEYKLDWVYNSNNLKVMDVTYVKDGDGEWQLSYTLADNAIAGVVGDDKLEIWYTYDDGSLPVSYSPSKTAANGSLNYVDGAPSVMAGSTLEFSAFVERGYSYTISVTAGGTALDITDTTASRETGDESVYTSEGDFTVAIPAGITEEIVVTAAYTHVDTITFSPEAFKNDEHFGLINNNGEQHLNDVSKPYSDDGVTFTFEFDSTNYTLESLEINHISCSVPYTNSSTPFETTIVKDNSGDSDKDCIATITASQSGERNIYTLKVEHCRENITVTKVAFRSKDDPVVVPIASGEGIVFKNESLAKNGSAITSGLNEGISLKSGDTERIRFDYGMEKGYKNIYLELYTAGNDGRWIHSYQVYPEKEVTADKPYEFIHPVGSTSYVLAKVSTYEGADGEYQYQIDMGLDYYVQTGAYFEQVAVSCEPIKYNVVYDVEEGTGSVTDEIPYYTITSPDATVTLAQPTPPEDKLFYGWTTEDPTGKEPSDLTILFGGETLDLFGDTYSDLLNYENPTTGYDGTLTLYAVYLDELPEGTPGTAVVKTYLQDSTGAYAPAADGDHDVEITTGQSLTVYDSYINNNPNVNNEYYTYNAELSNPYLATTKGSGDEIRLYYDLDFTGNVSIDDWIYGHQAADPAAWIEVTDESGTSSSETDSKVGSAYTQGDYVYYQANDDGSKGSQLSGKPTEAGSYIVELTWTMTVTALDADDKQTQVTQTLTAQDTFTILESVNKTVTKIWDDASDQDGIRPDSISVQLYADGEAYGDPVTMSETGDEWTYTWKYLTRYNGDQEIVYMAKETEEIADYTTSYSDDGLTITNTHTPETIEISGSKTWEDDDNRDGVRPESITILLKADGDLIQSLTVEPDDQENWTWDFTDLPKYDAGERITYKISEDTPDHYQVSYDDNYNITNTHQPDTTSISVSKTWKDNYDQDGLRTDSVTVQLYADGEPVDDQILELNESNDWTGTFSGVDLYEDQGERIQYTVKEAEVPEGYTASVSQDFEDATSFTITNTHTPETYDIDVNMFWDDADNQDGVRPDEVTVTLYANGKKDASRIISADGNGNWTCSFSDIPKYQNGEEITYTIVEDEDDIEGYTGTVTGNAQDGFTITNTHTPETIEISGSKTWDDDNNNDGFRPDSITIRVKADGSQALDENGNEITATVTDEEDWSWDFNNLPKYDAGKEITYTVTEDAVPHYATSYTEDGCSVLNVHTPDQTSLTVTVAWDDSKNQDGIRPESVTLDLLADGDETGQSVELSASDNWTYTFTGLDMYKDGNEVNYTVEESAVPDGYTVDISGDATAGYTVTNTHTPETIEIDVTKIWDDADDQDGMRPESITVRLLADGKQVEQVEDLTPDMFGSWTWSFNDKPKYRDEGTEIVYTITEDAVEGYLEPDITGDAENGFEIYNVHTPETIDITGRKTWDDDDNNDGDRPGSITIRVKADGSQALDENGNEITATVTDEEDWSWDFNNLPKYDAGKEISYAITEDAVPHYSTTYAGYNVTNAHTPDQTSLTVTVAWDDSKNQDGIRPASVTLKLLADGVDTGRTVVLSASNNWTSTFTGLDMYKDEGETIVYTVEEATVPEGYTVTISGDATTGYTVTDTHTPETIEISGSKTWDDDNNNDGDRPDSITIRLLADQKESRSVTVTVEDDWSWTFTDLPKYENGGTEIAYVVTEDAVLQYSATYDGYDVTNTHTPDQTSLTVTKVWDDANDQDGIRPGSVTVKLLADGKDTGETLLLNASNNWKGSFTGLDIYEDQGETVKYSVEEEAVPEGYTVAVTGDAAAGYTITNTHTPAMIDISGSKTWDDDNNNDGDRPSSITIRLKADGVDVDSVSVTPDEDGNWNWTFTDMPKYKAGKEITYTITEDAVDHYATGYESAYDKVVNVHTPDQTSLTVSVTWDDQNNQDGIRPDSITIKLLADGEDTGRTIELSASDNWRGSFTGLEMYHDQGERIQYTLEAEVDGYEVSVIGDATTGYTITFTHVPETIDISGSKTWKDDNNNDGDRPDEITIRLLADGTEVNNTTVAPDENGEWSWIFNGYDKYRDGGTEIVYTITEDAVENYSTDYDDAYNVTNTHTPDQTSVTVTKVWYDVDNQDGIRPDSVTVKLLADGEDTGKTLELSEADQWTGTFTELDMYQDKGEKIKYTVEEADVPDGYEAAVTGDATKGFTISNTHETKIETGPGPEVPPTTGNPDKGSPDTGNPDTGNPTTGSKTGDISGAEIGWLTVLAALGMLGIAVAALRMRRSRTRK